MALQRYKFRKIFQAYTNVHAHGYTEVQYTNVTLYYCKHSDFTYINTILWLTIVKNSVHRIRNSIFGSSTEMRCTRGIAFSRNQKKSS